MIFYAGKDSRKRKKILKLLNSVTYDEKTKEYYVKSLTSEDKKHIVFYDEAKRQYICDCKAILYENYTRYKDLKERNQKYHRRGCIHVLTTKIWIALRSNDNRF